MSKYGGSGADASRLGATEVTFESTPEPIPESRTRSSVDDKPRGNLGDLIAVLALEEFLDFIESLEWSSLSFVGDRLTPEVRELGLSSSASSGTLLILEGVAFLCCDTSVSGGLGGLPSLGTVAPWGARCSTDLVFTFSSSPTSVDSGVYGLFPSFVCSLTSSLLFTASLLNALLKLGYGRLLREVDPGAEAVRESSGTRSAIDVDGSESLSFSLSLSLSFRRRWDDLTGSPVSGSMIFGRELLDDLWVRFGSLSFFSRCLFSLGLSSTSSSRSLYAILLSGELKSAGA